MARGAWDRTAALAVIISEPYRDAEEHPAPYQPGDFHPLREAVPFNDIMPYDPNVLIRMQKGID